MKILGVQRPLSSEVRGKEVLTSGGLVSPTGGLVSRLSTSGFAMVAAAITKRQYLLHVVPEQEPDLFRQRHIDTEIGKKCTRIGAVVMVMHGNSFSLKSLASRIAHTSSMSAKKSPSYRDSNLSSHDALIEVSAVKRSLSRE